MVNTCQKLTEWNWKAGNEYLDNTTSVAFKRNYFDCGLYYFDGIFNVVKFPKGMTIYHGSGILADEVVEFPVGINFYKTYNMKSPNNLRINPSPNSPQFLNLAANLDENIEELISKSINITAGWYADPSVAQLYSINGTDKRINTICKDKCIFSYTVKEDIVLFLLDDDYNIAKLFQSDNRIVPVAEKINLSKMFNIQIPPGQTQPVLFRTNLDRPFERLRYEKMRISDRTYDKPFADWVCQNIISPFKYAGYGATTQKTFAHGGQFHLEFVFCNAFKWLKRDLDSPYDWQYLNKDKIPLKLKLFIEQLKLYETTNVNFHSGNLYQHSVWTLLNAEELTSTQNLFMINYPVEFQKVISFAAFIHDIGKMYPTDQNIVKYNQKRKKFIYFAIKQHPIYGEDYILGKRMLPIFDTNANKIVGFFNIDELFKEFGIKLEFKLIIAGILGMHWEFGNALKFINENPQANINEVALKYIELAKLHIFQELDQNDTRFVIYAMMVVSIADILATLPYGVKKLGNAKDGLNYSSKFFPFIKNVPKKYRGGNIAEISNIKQKGIQLANYILSKI